MSNIIEMETTFNGHVLGTSDTFTIDIYTNKEDKRYAELGDTKYKLNIFKIGNILEFIFRRNNVDVTVRRDMKLWKVNDKKKAIIEKNVSTVEGIVQELHGKVMEPDELFEDYFEDELNNKNFIVSNIHIISIIPGTGIKEIIDKIKKDASKSIHKASDPLDMPLQQRNFEDAMQKIKWSIHSNFTGKTGKSDYWCLVSGGAPGIGKTRFGIELFNQVKKDLPQYIKDTFKKHIDIHFEYLRIDFGNGYQLTKYDCGLDPSVVIGLRIAHAFFIQDECNMKLLEFLATLNSSRDKNFSNFTIGSVIEERRKSLNLPKTHVFYLYLHIDEFQLIDSWANDDQLEPSKRFFNRMIREIADFMYCTTSSTTTSSNFIQPFFSGTASQVVLKQKEASSISFQFVECPLLDDESTIRIMDHFADSFKGAITNYSYRWKFCTSMLILLRDTGGLPRALEQLFITCFGKHGEDGKDFFKKLDRNAINSTEIFFNVKTHLDERYGIKNYVKYNKNVAMKLMYYCIEGIAIDPDERLVENNPKITIRSLERDKHIILSPVEQPLSPVEQPADEQSTKRDLFLINMPFYFICLYNDVLCVVDPKFYSVKIYWEEWEFFVAYHEAFRTNLAIKMGKNVMTLRDLYPGADETDVVFDMSVKLKSLRVCEAIEQFPGTTKLTDKRNSKSIDWKSGDVVVVNGKSAPFADVFLCREGQDTNHKYLMMNQCKWDYGSTIIKDKTIEGEDKKNLQNFYKDVEDKDGSIEYVPITIIFTSQPYVEEQLRDDGVLVISKEKFKKHFGPVFFSRASFAITRDINPNFWDANRLKNVLAGIGDNLITKVINKRPYYSDDDFYKKIPEADNDRNKRQKKDYHPFNLSPKLQIENRDNNDNN